MAPEAAADEAEKLLEGGFRAVKLRLGYPTLAADLAAVRAVRKRLPVSVELMVDYNQALSPAEAFERGRALEHEGIAWIEEPIRHDDFRNCAELARTLATPIQIGENFSLPEQMQEAILADACDFVMPDLERIGGVSGWLRALGFGGGGARRCAPGGPKKAESSLCPRPSFPKRAPICSRSRRPATTSSTSTGRA